MFASTSPRVFFGCFCLFSKNIKKHPWEGNGWAFGLVWLAAWFDLLVGLAWDDWLASLVWFVWCGMVWFSFFMFFFVCGRWGVGGLV